MYCQGKVQWSCVRGLLAVLFLFHGALGAPQAPQKPEANPQVVDMGTYKVSVPPGKWSVERPSQIPVVTFSKHKEGLLNQLAQQARAFFITVASAESAPQDWYMTESQAAARWTLGWIKTVLDDPSNSSELVEKGETQIGDKKLYFAKFLDISPGENIQSDMIVYFYFPPAFKKSHTLFYFQYGFSHTLARRLYKAPGTDALEAVVNSLEIVDPLQAVPGLEGDLLRAAAGSDLDAVRQAVAKGASVNASTAGRTPLSVAALNGRREVVDLLLAQGAELNKGDETEGRTALVQAIVGGEPEIAEALVGHDADVNLRTKSGLSPLMCAICMRLDGLVALLLDKNAAIDSETSEGETPLTFAARAGSFGSAKALLDRGVPIDHRCKLGRTALIDAANSGHADIARMLIDRGANVNLQTKEGWTALMAAIDQGQPELAAILIAKGADVNAKQSNGFTALMVAAESGDVATAKLLLDKGALVNAKAGKNTTALTWAKIRKNAELVKLLRAAGAK